MMSLFSVFDPVSCGLQLNWVSAFVVIIFIPATFYFMKSNVKSMLFFLFSGLGVLLYEIVFPYGKGIVLLGFGVFMYFMMNNVMGLFSFVFTSTAHPMFTLSVGFVYWVVFVLLGWFKNFKNSIGHLVPEGSPLVLAPVLVMIELISQLIRPFTLSVRLAANMMAGHLILGLLSSISMVSSMSFVFSVVLQMVLFILEFGVALIQGVVFSILMLLYVVESY